MFGPACVTYDHTEEPVPRSKISNLSSSGELSTHVNDTSDPVIAAVSPEGFSGASAEVVEPYWQ
jgi:hypothetical protein